ncbi:MAG: hypothetical protein PHT02_09645 [Tissierellia bacterium]|nr:hypothetical protein [Tissierellia bacterium]
MKTEIYLYRLLVFCMISVSSLRRMDISKKFKKYKRTIEKIMVSCRYTIMKIPKLLVILLIIAKRLYFLKRFYEYFYIVINFQFKFFGEKYV